MFRRSLTALVAFAFVFLGVPLGALPAASAPTELFFSEYVEGSSNNKALEIYNGTGAPINLSSGAYSVQVFFNGAASAGLTINLTGSVAAGDVYVLAHSSANATILAQADQTNGAGWFNGDDAVVLRKGATVIDAIGQIGFDPGTEWGAGLTSTADNTLQRKAAIQAGDTNGSDAFDPAIEWDGFPTDTFTGLGSHASQPGDQAPTVSATTPSNGATEVPTNSNITVTFSEPVNAGGGAFALTCTRSGAVTLVVTPSGASTTYALDPQSDLQRNETCTVTVEADAVTDVDVVDPPDNMAGDHTFTFSTTGLALRIHDIQSTQHLSPYDGSLVSLVPGVVTAVSSSGFWFQDPEPDADVRTSEGIFVFTGSPPGVIVGSDVRVSGRVQEFRAGCTPTCLPTSSAFDNLTITEIVTPTATAVGVGTVPPTVVGLGGRVPPITVIEDDSDGNVETSNTFDPAEDGIDFYESLEGMLVQINDAVVVGPRNNFGEIPVLSDNGSYASVRTARGGIVVRKLGSDPAPHDYEQGDFNPERMILDDVIRPTPRVDVNDRFTTAVRAVVDYGFANYKFLVLNELTPVDGGLQREITTAPRRDELSVASFNVENLAGTDSAEKYAALARLIVNNMRAPDLIAIEEVQDNDGTASAAPTDASVTWNRLIAAILAAGGPRYDYRQIDPVSNMDGGAPNGNIRVGFLFRADRGLSFVDRAGGTAINATHDDPAQPGAQLTFSPGRVDPTNPAFNQSRKPLAGEFRWRDETFFAIANHFSSKGGDDPLFGRFQPPIRGTEVQRHQQAAVVNAFVDELLAADPRARIIVLGDINDFEFSETVAILKGDVLETLMETLPQRERYSYVFEGNSQVLDQILVSRRLLHSVKSYDSVHVNAEFADQDSDHDPQVALLRFGNNGSGNDDKDDEDGDED